MTPSRTLAGLACLVALVAAGCRDAALQDTSTTGDAPAPAPSTAGSALPGTGGERLGWPVTGRSRVDVDGDGVEERLRLRAREWPGRGDPLQVVVTFADGTTSVTDLVHQPFAAVFRSADIDRHPGAEVFLLREVPRRTFAVLTWRDGGLVEIRTPRGRPLTDDFQRKHAHRWWVEDGQVLSYVSEDPFHFGYDTVDTPATYAVRAQRWSVQGLRLTPYPMGRYCVRATAPERLRAC
jgi:hypothetical protein